MKVPCKFSGIIYGILVAVCVFIIVLVFRSVFVIDLLTDWGFQGVILIEKDNRVILRKSVLKELNPQFLCASLIKQITSTLILKELEKKNLRLSDKANKYLNESQKIDDSIEIQHLLFHSSGLQMDNSVKFSPGSNYEYLNQGYVILGMILENITKTSFSDLAQNLFTELNLTDSFLVDAPTLPEIKQKHPRFVLSEKAETTRFFYTEEDGKLFFPRNSCGGLISSAEDLSRWNNLLHEEKILSHDVYRLMIAPQIKSNFPKGYYGYGICRYSSKEIYHIGYACGYKSTISYFPKSKISLVILENYSCDNYKKDFQKHCWIRWLIRRFM